MSGSACACGHPLTLSINLRSNATHLAKALIIQHTKETAGKLRFISQVSFATCTHREPLACIATDAPPTGVTVLVDPWLEGDLIFANQTWLYRGSKGALNDVKLDLDQIASQSDVILLSQVRAAC